MPETVYENMILVDTSAVIALHDPGEKFHNAAVDFFQEEQSFMWFAVNVTSHETFTRVRYKSGVSVK